MNKLKYLFVFLFLAISINFVSSELTDGLKSYWKFDETTGNLLDSISTNDINIFSAGITKGVSGKISNAIYSGTGAREYMYGSANTDINSITGDLSISFWIKTAFSQGWLFIIKSTGGSNNEQISSLSIGLDGSNTVISLGEPLSSGDCSTNPDCAFAMIGIVNDLNNNTWQHIVFTRKKSATDTDLKIYRNGTEVNYAYRKNRNQDQVATNLIRTEFLGLDYYDGTTKANLDEFGIWNRELSQSEVTQLYNSGNGNSYPFLINQPTASVSTGTYYDPFQVTLDNNSIADIYYTLDGSEPDDTKTLYTEPININETTTLKAISWVSDENKSLVATYTYTIREPIQTITFYDENTLLAIPTVTITDANGSTYDSNSGGVLVYSLSNIAKDLTISKTGYDSRKLQFYFKRQDANYNFMLSKDGNSSNIEFLVKDSNNLVWSDRYLMFKKGDMNIISSVLTSSTGTATASLLANGDYNALLYTADGNLSETYTKTTVTVSKPKNEKTLADISPYDVSVGGLLTYSVSNQTAASISVNIFGGTTSTYDFSVVDYNANPADRKYVARSFYIKNPFGDNYNTAYPIQPYLVKSEDSIIPVIYTIDSIRRPVPNVLIKIYKNIGTKLELIEMKTTDSMGRLSYSAYPLDRYYFVAYYNGIEVGSYNFEPRSSDEITYLVVNLYSDIEFGFYPEIYIDWNLSEIYNIKTQNIDVLADVSLKSVETDLDFTSYTISINQGGSILSTQTYSVSGTSIDVNHTFDKSLLDGNIYYANIVLDVYYDSNGVSYTQKFRIMVGIQESTTNLFTIMKSVPIEIGRLFAIILAILITIGILSFITLQVAVDERVISVLGMAILGIFFLTGWISSGILVLGVDIMTYGYILGCVTVIYFMTLRR